VVAQTAFGDDLSVEWDPDARQEDSVVIEGADLTGKDSTVWHALQIFRKAAGIQDGVFQIRLSKRIPIGAGLGGGSSNATGLFRALQELFPDLSSEMDWHGMAEQVGSDCPLFLHQYPVIMEGRGERIQRLDDALADRIASQPVILFKPSFSTPTGEAYQRLAKGGFYRAGEDVQKDMMAWAESSEMLPSPWNDFERLVEHWLPSLAVVLNRLRNVHGLDARMSGSGSACFVFAKDSTFAMTRVQEELTKAWGRAFWIVETVLN
jgi:4-diphosphocytidyl-2-C-methyl-D-erythritol kinase